MKQNIKRGRNPVGEKPMTAAQRKKRQREKLTALGDRTITIELSGAVIDVVDEYRKFTGETRSEAIENALTTWAIDTAEALPGLAEWVEKRNLEDSKTDEAKQ